VGAASRFSHAQTCRPYCSKSLLSWQYTFSPLICFPPLFAFFIHFVLSPDPNKTLLSMHIIVSPLSKLHCLQKKQGWIFSCFYAVTLAEKPSFLYSLCQCHLATLSLFVAPRWHPSITQSRQKTIWRTRRRIRFVRDKHGRHNAKVLLAYSGIWLERRSHSCIH
jgi:hypothetical protein